MQKSTGVSRTDRLSMTVSWMFLSPSTVGRVLWSITCSCYSTSEWRCAWFASALYTHHMSVTCLWTWLRRRLLVQVLRHLECSRKQPAPMEWYRTEGRHGVPDHSVAVLYQDGLVVVCMFPLRAMASALLLGQRVSRGDLWLVGCIEVTGSASW